MAFQGKEQKKIEKSCAKSGMLESRSAAFHRTKSVPEAKRLLKRKSEALRPRCEFD